MEENYDCLPDNNTTVSTMSFNKPVISVVIGQGLNKIIKAGHVEFTNEIICQKIILKGINCDISNYSFFIECINANNDIRNIATGDTINLRRHNWFSETKYRIIAQDDINIENVIAEFSISWPSRQLGVNAKNDLVSLLIIQSDPNISLPKRTFWNMWSRIGQGITQELEEYRETGKLLGAIGYTHNNLFRGIRSVFEHGTDDQIRALVYAITSMYNYTCDNLRFHGKKLTETLEIDHLFRDIGVIYGYEYHISDEFIMYFRD